MMYDYQVAAVNNITEAEINNDSDTNSRIVDFRPKKSQVSSSIQKKTLLNTSTPEAERKEITFEENRRIVDDYYFNEKKYKLLIDRLERELILLLKGYSLENETLSLAEKKIYDIADEYSFRILGDVLLKIYIRYYNVPNVIAGICAGLERYDANEVMPWGHSMVIGLINHADELVKERVISLIENWADVSLLPALKSIEISSDWMEEYIREVITFLEEKECTI